MDLRERYHSESELLREVMDTVQSRIFTAIPVQVTKDSDGHTVSLKPLIKFVQRMPTGEDKLISLPEIPEAPVHFKSGGGFVMTHPVKEKDYGWAMVPFRSIDAYQQQGGEQPQTDARMHDLSDAFYMPGARPDPDKIKDYDKDAAVMRSVDGKHAFSLNPMTGNITASVDGGKHTFSLDKAAGIKMATELAVAMKSGKGFTLDGATKLLQGLNVTGNIDASGTIGSPKGLLGTLAAFTGVSLLAAALGALAALYVASGPALEARVAAAVDARLRASYASLEAPCRAAPPVLRQASAGVP